MADSLNASDRRNFEDLSPRLINRIMSENITASDEIRTDETEDPSVTWEKLPEAVKKTASSFLWHFMAHRREEEKEERKRNLPS